MFTSKEVFTLLHTYTLNELALIVSTYYVEAVSFLLDANAAWQCLIALIAAITRHQSDTDRACFDAALTRTFEGLTMHDEVITTRLPTFDYVPRGNRVGIYITFPFDFRA